MNVIKDEICGMSASDLIARCMTNPNGVEIRRSRWTRFCIRIEPEFAGFPRVIAEIIEQYVVPRVRLRDWIPDDNLNNNTLYANPNAYHAGMLELNPKCLLSSQLRHLARNPACAEFILKNRKLVDFPTLWENPALIDHLLDNLKPGESESCGWLASNPSKRAVDHILANLNKFFTPFISYNPCAIDWLRANPDKIDKTYICANPAAIDIIQALPEIDYSLLSRNPHPWAIEQMQLNPTKIHWEYFSENPAIFETGKCQELINALTEH